MNNENITIQLRDSEGNLKFEFENTAFNDLFNKGLLAMTKKSIRKYKDGSSATVFTFTEGTVFTSTFGRLYFWKNDCIMIEGI